MKSFLTVAKEATQEAGKLLKAHFGSELVVDAMHDYDIKLAMDVQSQALLSEKILAAFPDHAIFGEEGTSGNQQSPYQWVLDPIDGTVNYFYEIPHFCISVALRHKKEWLAGVIFDPMQRELWEVEKDSSPLLNGKKIQVSSRTELSESVGTIGFSKTRESMEAGLTRFKEIISRIKKVRLFGSAALGMAYIASGRLDFYLEDQISLWDIAAGIQLVENAGGKVMLKPIEGKPATFQMLAFNGKVNVEQFFITS